MLHLSSAPLILSKRLYCQHLEDTANGCNLKEKIYYSDLYRIGRLFSSIDQGKKRKSKCEIDLGLNAEVIMRLIFVAFQIVHRSERQKGLYFQAWRTLAGNKSLTIDAYLVLIKTK